MNRLIQISLASLAFVSAHESVAITNGRTVSEAETPQIVHILSPDIDCTGVVVGTGIILTADHCLSRKGPAAMLVNGQQVIDIFVPTPEENQRTKLDLLLLRVPKEVTQDVLPIRRIPLPHHSIEVMIMGYGNAYAPGLPVKIDTSSTKRAGLNILVNDPKVRNESYFNLRFEPGPFDRAKPSGALPGDSGGPMVYENAVVGIASKSFPVVSSAFGISNYTNILSARSFRFLEEARAKGWSIRFQ